jgi:NAD(P)-dependent dehydrogenase (short-subunit alcohol dehydrogenase family)
MVNMAEIEYSEAVAQNVRGRVIVVTEGARGIGGETVTLLHGLGAHVVFGDVLESAGTELVSSLSSSQLAKPAGGSVYFVKTNVCSYAGQLALFEDAFRRHGRVDAAVTCAGVLDHPDWFDPSKLTLDAVRDVPFPIFSRYS